MVVVQQQAPETTRTSALSTVMLTGKQALLRFFEVMGYERGREIWIAVGETEHYQGFIAERWAYSAEVAQRQKNWAVGANFWRNCRRLPVSSETSKGRRRHFLPR